MNKKISHPKFLRFSIASVLLLAACVAGMLAGYRVGFNRGYSSGMEKRFAERPFVKIYELDQVLSNFDATQSELDEAAVGRLDLVFSAIESTIEPDTWEVLGGVGTMRPMGENAIAVNQRPYVQEQIAKFLEQPDLAPKTMRQVLDESLRMAKYRRSAQPMGMGMGTMEVTRPDEKREVDAEPADASEPPS